MVSKIKDTSGHHKVFAKANAKAKCWETGNLEAKGRKPGGAGGQGEPGAGRGLGKLGEMVGTLGRFIFLGIVLIMVLWFSLLLPPPCMLSH